MIKMSPKIMRQIEPPDYERNATDFFLQESKVAQSLFGKDHLIKGISVHIGSAQPRTKSSQNHDHGGGGGSGGGQRFGRGYDYGAGGGANPWQAGNSGYSRGNGGGHRNYYH